MRAQTKVCAAGSGGITRDSTRNRSDSGGLAGSESHVILPDINKRARYTKHCSVRYTVNSPAGILIDVFNRRSVMFVVGVGAP